MSFAFNFDGKPAAAPVVREEFKGRIGWLAPDEEEEDDGAYNTLNLDLGISLQTKNGHSQSKLHAVAKDTEVVPLVYEGGFKIWECSFDIISTLATENHTPKRILDLGCGAGVVGIWCLKRFPQCHVTFHDLNDTVLEQVTMPNVRRNLGCFARTSFCCGPWHVDSVDLGKYDLVVSGDTMYNVDALPDLITILLRTLDHREPGRAVLAAKRYYFGVGGGSSTFCSMVKQRTDCKAVILNSVTDGNSNIRDVVEFQILQ